MNLFLFAIGARDRASSRLRVWDHADWLRGQGHDVVIDSVSGLARDHTRARFVLRLLRRYPRWMTAFFRADAVLVQETLLLWPALLFKNLGRRRQVVFDFSDPIDRVGSGIKRALRRRLFNFVVARADVVVVENPAYLDLLSGLARRLDHFYGPVDATRYGQGHAAVEAAGRGRAVRIGWGGSTGTLGFITPLLPLIDELAEHRDIEVLLFGIASADGISLRHARLTVMAWDEAAEFATIPSFDLGLFRLEPTEDARWRGAGKLFTYMAAGVPFIASDVGIARRLMHEAQVGFAVGDDADWRRELESAIDAQARRQEMIPRSLVFAREQLSYDAFRQRLLAHLAHRAGK